MKEQDIKEEKNKRPIYEKEDLPGYATKLTTLTEKKWKSLHYEGHNVPFNPFSLKDHIQKLLKEYYIEFHRDLLSWETEPQRINLAVESINNLFKKEEIEEVLAIMETFTDSPILKRFHNLLIMSATGICGNLNTNIVSRDKKFKKQPQSSVSDVVPTNK